jgi:broad-specificity NMP kinase
LYDPIDRCGAEKVCEINVTGRKVENVAEEILQILNKRNGCKIGLVDWPGKLDEYLKDF